MDARFKTQGRVGNKGRRRADKASGAENGGKQIDWTDTAQMAKDSAKSARFILKITPHFPDLRNFFNPVIEIITEHDAVRSTVNPANFRGTHSGTH